MSVPLPFSNILIRMQGSHTPLVYLHRAVVLCFVEMMLSPPFARIVQEGWYDMVNRCPKSCGFVWVSGNAKRKSLSDDASDWFEVGFTNLIEALMGA